MQKNKVPKGANPLFIQRNKPQINALIQELQGLDKKTLRLRYWALLCDNNEFAKTLDPILVKMLTFDQIKKRLALALWENNSNGAVCHTKKVETYVKSQIQAICQLKDARAIYKIARKFETCANS